MLRPVDLPFSRRPTAIASTPRSTPRVSVVIPCYNYSAYLDEAVESAVTQEGVEVDVWIVDDASTDGSAKLAQQWAEKDPRVNVVLHTENRGHIVTFNEALARATAPYVVKLDADDVLTPGSLRRSTDLLDAHPEVAVVYGPVLHVRGAMPTRLPNQVSSWRIWSGERWLKILARRVHNPISQPEIVIRRAALLRTGGHLAEVPAASDLNLWLRLAAVGDVARISGAVQGLYRVHDKSMRATIHSGLLLDFESRRAAFELFLDQHTVPVPHRAQLAGSVRSALARDAVRSAFADFEAGLDPTELLNQAFELDPKVMRSWAWRSLQHQLRVGQPTRWGAFGRIKRDIDGRVRFRIHRRFGI